MGSWAFLIVPRRSACGWASMGISGTSPHQQSYRFHLLSQTAWCGIACATVNHGKRSYTWRRHPMELDLSNAQALPMLPFQAECLKLLVVGLVGTGSFLAGHVACLVCA